jgi:hypothetical protein
MQWAKARVVRNFGPTNFITDYATLLVPSGVATTRCYGIGLTVGCCNSAS